MLVAWQKAGQQSNMSATLTNNLILRAIFGRGGAGEEKEEGLWRTVDCLSRVDCLLSFQELLNSFQCRVQHAAPQGAAGLWTTASSADFWF